MSNVYGLAAFLAVATTFTSCKMSEFQDVPQYNSGSANAASTSYKYLADSDASAATTDESSESSTAVDSTVSSDITDTRIADMAARMLKDLDSDGSSSLSLEEFLAGPEKFAAKANHQKLKSLTDDQKAKMIETLTTEFNANAGEDALLSVDELKTLLLSQAPRIAEYRRGGPGHSPRKHGPRGFGPGRHEARGQQASVPPQMPSEEELFQKYDVNGDGHLDAAEFKAMLDARFKNRQVGPDYPGVEQN